ncbi:anhydro-N-acetylmuramic acid kinase [Yoonia maritima]|uniref:Anhydro-N-acetylmuramic acid kinase n=1 Tax=Yoonia maritima TaxID=1435347 RepID=A0A2T0W1D2_9RHOB|nr:anhydro-N-acetylmuramic acid kinase [Yoonia maritima]PRY78789.1 anhydro-N-acetylmuramic acid kinase [Yoonia maritima]
MLKTGFVKALGTMSGTSLDGVDAAVIETDGVTIKAFGTSDYRPYSAPEQLILRDHLGRWPEDGVSHAAKVVEDAHIAIMSSFADVDVAGFHGQTLAHDPGGRGTHQCGDGQRLADELGFPVIWDLRANDVAQGGQGAPLAPFYHFALAKWIGADTPVAFLNLGGVGNITWVDPKYDDPASDGALLAFDTGPANAPINDAMQERLGIGYDTEGQLAAQGTPEPDIIAAFLANPYFSRLPPKSLDRDEFVGLSAAVTGLSNADAIATLTKAVTESVAHAITQCPKIPARLLLCGGGRKNVTVMNELKAATGCDVIAVEDVGLDGDMLEAQAFAFLAVRAARGLPISAPKTTGVNRPTTGGRAAMPGDSVEMAPSRNLHPK